MGVDLHAIIDHRMEPRQLIDLPACIDSWTDIASLKEFRMFPAKWSGGYEMTQEVLTTIWKDWETGTSLSAEKLFDNHIECFFGQVDVYRKSLVVCQWDHKYSNLCDPAKARILLEINRYIARHLHASLVVYAPDSAFPTSSLSEEPQKGKDAMEIRAWGIETFGEPPRDISRAMEYMFFYDDLKLPLGQLKEWDTTSQTYWRYQDGKYVLKNG